MGKRILDSKLVAKLCKVTGKSEAAIGVKVSKLAAKRRVAPQIALVLLCEKHGVGTAVYQRTLNASHQAAIRDELAKGESPPRFRIASKISAEKRTVTKRETLKRAIELLIYDPTLRSKCSDILMARSSYERPINQATLVLEDRIRKRVKPRTPLVGEQLVNYAFNERLEKTRLQVASAQADEQRGITQILRGFVPAFRNVTHHHIVDTFTQEDAIRICCFIDILLRVVDSTNHVVPSAIET